MRGFGQYTFIIFITASKILSTIQYVVAGSNLIVVFLYHKVLLYVIPPYFL